jgi:hydrogenase large subunit
MPTLVPIDPVTRLEGHLKVEISVDHVNGVQQVVDARCSGTMFRGFENLLVGRKPIDAIHITQRICGVCPVAHGAASAAAIEAAAGISLNANGRVMRNIVNGADFLHSHILHFYHLVLSDFTDIANIPPWTPSWRTDKRSFRALKPGSGSAGSARGAASQSAPDFLSSYRKALDVRRKAHELGAYFGGRLPHAATFVPGGVTAFPKTASVTAGKALLREIISFIETTWAQDLDRVAKVYPDYYSIGRGPGNLLAFGVFDLVSGGASRLLRRGRVEKGSTTVQTVDVNGIAEQVGNSYYAETSDNLRPSAGQTVVDYPKPGAYSWLKAPRYFNDVYELGPLARMWVNGDYRRGISVMDRHAARMQEAYKLANAMLTWFDQLTLNQSGYVSCTPPSSATSFGLTEAARGALGHWYTTASGLITRYQIITPTCWNASPRDDGGVPGAIEQALIGTPIRNAGEPVEALRVIHSFDPCLACAVHVTRPGEANRVFALGM